MYIVLTKPDTDNEKGKLELINGTKEQCDTKVAELINSGISESKIDNNRIFCIVLYVSSFFQFHFDILKFTYKKGYRSSPLDCRY